MKKTQYYDLNKPDGSDYAKIEAINETSDKVDAALHGLDEKLAQHKASPVDHVDIRNAIASAQAAADEARSLAEGRSRAVTYTGYSTMVAAVNLMDKTAMRVGDNLLLEALGVPDLWVSNVEATAVIYTYTTDEALEATLENGPVQMGYYKLSVLETPKVDLSGYVPTTRTINGKPLTANITLTAGDVGALETQVGATGQVLGFTAPNTVGAMDAPGGGKRTCRFVVGTSTAGWTAKDCDYLCDGTADQVEINAAIQALPATGGEVVILDGTYNIAASVAVNKKNTKLSGNGTATVLKRMWNSSSIEGAVHVTASSCIIADLMIAGNKNVYTSSRNVSICLFSSNNTIIGNTCSNNAYVGISLSSSSNNTITGNTCSNNAYVGIGLSSSSNNNTITGNACNSNGNTAGISLSSSSNNTITGNTCNSNDKGISLDSSSNNTITGNACNDNNVGIYLKFSSNNTITSNTCIRGIGSASDYESYQYGIQIVLGGSNYNLIADNNIMGKNYSSDGGTSNTFVNNKFE